MATVKFIIAALFHDRVVQLGTGSSTVSLFGAVQLGGAPAQWVGYLTTYIGLYAAVVGGLSATATFVYAIIKIKRLLKDKSAD